MKKYIISIAGWAVSIAFISYFVATMDLSSIWAEISQSNIGLIILSAAINILVVALKALRWQQLSPDTKLSYLKTLAVTFIGFAGNNILPARGGDILKIHTLRKWGTARSASLVSLAGLDKFFDGLSILIVFGILALHSPFPPWVLKGALIFALAILALLLTCVALLLHWRRIQDDDHTNASHFRKVICGLGRGLEALSETNTIASTITNSIAICALQIISLWICQLAFGSTLPIWVAALAFVTVNLAIAIPSAPSGIGPFEAACVVTYAWQGATDAQALGIAIAYHAIQFIPVTLIGFATYILTRSRGSVKESL